MFRYMPEQGSTFATKVDFVNNLIMDISVFFTVAIVGTMIYFAIRYRQRDGKDHATPRILGSHSLEVIWTVVPTLICIVVAWIGYTTYKEMRTVPPGALQIDVRGQKWKWDFYYPGGKETNGELVVPVDKPIKLVMKSRDVLHSFYIPDMRVKNDVIPGSYSYLWFQPVKTGDYTIYCTEYCGTQHSGMLATLKVVSEAEYERWINDNSAEFLQSEMTPAEQGKAVYTKKGCNACHSLTGQRVIGPSFLKLYNREGSFDDGVAYVADENYLTESILYPNKNIVAGYDKNLMPSFEGQVSDEELDALIAFIKSLDGSAPIEEAPEEDIGDLTPLELGQKLYTEKACIGCHSIDGSKLIGPSFQGIFGREGKLSSGDSYVVDEAYVKNSILKPQAQIVAGYENALMPPYEGQLSDEQIEAIITFMKSL